MDRAQIREAMEWLAGRVELTTERDGRCATSMPPCDAEEMLDAGLDPDVVERIAAGDWWDEMVADVMETPEFCADDDLPEQILQYARDVVREYVRKRF